MKIKVRRYDFIHTLSIFYQKMKSNNSEITVEPILDGGKIRESYEKVWTVEILQIWEVDFSIRLDVLNK